MHVLGATEFLVTLGLSVASTALVSRILLLILGRWRIGIGRLPIVHGLSFVLCWILFVLWCSTPAGIYWFSGHVIVIPQIGWFILDILRYDDEEAGEEESSTEMDRRAD